MVHRAVLRGGCAEYISAAVSHELCGVESSGQAGAYGDAVPDWDELVEADAETGWSAAAGAGSFVVDGGGKRVAGGDLFWGDFDLSFEDAGGGD